MSVVDSIFDRLSQWRYLPDYQLERRADIFFACYLPDILKNRNHIIQETIIPEFPMRKGTLGLTPENLSFKIDYLAVTKDLTKVFFIELKTEMKSISENQCINMVKAASKDIGIKKLIDGILTLFKETREKRKYYRLLQMIEQLGLIKIPASVQEIMDRKRLNGINRLLRNKDVMNINEWYIAKDLQNYEICYILPRNSKKLSAIDPTIKQITFRDFIEVASIKNDEFSRRFVLALEQWALRGA
ncbi:hypothetical protein [Dehalococcoides mccartyi]|uniref:hypothetical protein n=1 Tax=Dehalococcoides mccartyi TaxID=61435 RepID=UPI002FC8E7AB